MFLTTTLLAAKTIALTSTWIIGGVSAVGGTILGALGVASMLNPATAPAAPVAAFGSLSCFFIGFVIVAFVIVFRKYFFK